MTTNPVQTRRGFSSKIGKRAHRRSVPSIALIVTVLLTAASAAHAHLMVAQRGTLNLVDDGAFLVLSVPVTTFAGVDDDGDGAMSMNELNRHRDVLTSAVVKGARLLDDGEPLALQGIMLTPSLPHDDPESSAAHLIVMGRFALPESPGTLRLEIDLFGVQADERHFTLSLTRKASNEHESVELSPERPAHSLFEQVSIAKPTVSNTITG